ncbi:BRO-N domain-containing protein [Serpentinimonas barnesii]|uniref:BRO-N domain-containing protein n=1 Tax=Serpentinimonas barnesii TaxID=1458427 RepID=UPI0009716540|nr:Bro-N domain-containing protein [Serpentinimonas barnesii]
MSKKATAANPGSEGRIIVFQEQAIRRTWHQNEWWFSVVDVCQVLTESVDAGAYWRKLKQRLGAEASEVVTFCHGLKLSAPDGKQRITDCANTEGLLRIIQSIPSPKAEPFKRWLAQVGYERVKEIEDPELASARARALYESKGYPKDWIEKRLRSITVRGALTDEWKQRGVNEGREYSILTAEIARATFGVTPGDHRKLKGLEQAKAANLRDHMTDLELIFTMLGEASTTEIAKRKDAQGFQQNKTAAKEGGAVAGNARKELEAKSGQPVISPENHLAHLAHPAHLAPPGAEVSEAPVAPLPRKAGKKP